MTSAPRRPAPGADSFRTVSIVSEAAALRPSSRHRCSAESSLRGVCVFVCVWVYACAHACGGLGARGTHEVSPRSAAIPILALPSSRGLRRVLVVVVSS